MEKKIDLVRVDKNIRISKYSKNCNLEVDSQLQIYSYEFKKSKYTKKPKKVEIISKPKVPQNMNIIYYIHPSEKSLFTNLQQTRFNNIGHLSEYVIYSNQVPSSQLIFNWVLEFKKIPQITALLEFNRNKVPCIKSLGQNFDKVINFKISNIISNQSFWRELIRLYVIHSYSFESTLNLKYLNPSKLPQNLLIPIYYCGYQFYGLKFPELTEYMEHLFKANLKRVIFAPRLENIQALYIYCQIYFSNGDISLTRACLAALSRMCYSLGIPLNTKKFDINTNFNRKISLRRLITFDLYLAGPYKFFNKNFHETPAYDEKLYDKSWYLPSRECIEQLGEFNCESRVLSANLIVINTRFHDRTVEVMNLPNNQNINDNFSRISKLVENKLRILDFEYIHANSLISNLKQQFSSKSPENLIIIQEFESSIKVSYYHIYLVIIEYQRLNQLTLDPSILSKTLYLTNALFALVSTSVIYKNNTFYNYLIGFTYLNIIKSLSIEERVDVMRNFESLVEVLEGNFEEFDSLNLLLFRAGMKLINK
ncbi:hypothetical protein CONCODRAFT_87023 [Conidiobolus coronatus NRRL 28638]|uniref:Transcription factor domain-containing protein n=1 Tax=Conidiobolus coronatus (strain ATCC 28846 / CBS 209.66 / NRRL 28638) TaxID=796925 RepID=A0A137NX52_CONC2|nr:hypothetical protein CONCODRAFT_87023 [Conidiobolus coronatus NRRL 28638]|eukprot:KXN67336.1 hypothetical protein CONCODRAFT_87023 [Conidiobolus coronatus NRRL 28638]